jgi:hypothetical protein
VAQQNLVTELERLGRLRDSGLLTPEEFSQQKTKLLGSSNGLSQFTAAQPETLWNPTAAVNWSFLFGPFLGTFLHYLNWRRLGQPRYATFSLWWLFGFVAVVLLCGLAPESTWTARLSEDGSRGTVSFLGALIPASAWTHSSRSGLVGFAYLAVWYFLLGKRQAMFVKENFGTTYQHRSWAAPLTAGFLLWLGLLAATSSP